MVYIMKGPKHLTIGQRLRSERERHNWSQEQLAQEIGTTSLSINRKEHCCFDAATGNFRAGRNR